MLSIIHRDAFTDVSGTLTDLWRCVTTSWSYMCPVTVDAFERTLSEQKRGDPIRRVRYRVCDVWMDSDPQGAFPHMTFKRIFFKLLPVKYGPQKEHEYDEDPEEDSEGDESDEGLVYRTSCFQPSERKLDPTVFDVATGSSHFLLKDFLYKIQPPCLLEPEPWLEAPAEEKRNAAPKRTASQREADEDGIGEHVTAAQYEVLRRRVEVIEKDLAQQAERVRTVSVAVEKHSNATERLRKGLKYAAGGK